MTRHLTCIECPKGCRLTIEEADGKVIVVSGNQCEKGERYGVSEGQDPTRVLTSTVLAVGLPVKMIPVRTSGPVARDRIMDVMEVVKKIRVEKSVNINEVVCENVLGLGVDLITTRGIKWE